MGSGRLGGSSTGAGASSSSSCPPVSSGSWQAAYQADRCCCRCCWQADGSVADALPPLPPVPRSLPCRSVVKRERAVVIATHSLHRRSPAFRFLSWDSANDALGKDRSHTQQTCVPAAACLSTGRLCGSFASATRDAKGRHW